MRIIIVLLSSLFSVSLFANVIPYQTDTFADIASKYKQLGADPKTTLMVFDLDDTLITMSQPLGSVGWWDWQSALLKNDSNSDKLFTKNLSQLVRIQNILFQLIKMDVTDEYVIPFLNDAAQQGATLMGLTARGAEHLSATFMQLKDNQFTEGDTLLFRKHGLKFHHKTSVASHFHCPQFTREVLYQQGIMFLNGEDKGQALACVLATSKQAIKTIVFVDDAKHNIDSMQKAFEHRDDVVVLNVFYTRENAKELAVQTDTVLQMKLVDQWKFITTQLHSVIDQANV